MWTVIKEKTFYTSHSSRRNTSTYPEYFGVELVGQTEKKESRVFAEMSLQSVLTMGPQTLNLQRGAVSCSSNTRPQ